MLGPPRVLPIWPPNSVGRATFKLTAIGAERTGVVQYLSRRRTLLHEHLFRYSSRCGRPRIP